VVQRKIETERNRRRALPRLGLSDPISPNVCTPGQYFVSDPVTIDTEPGAVEFENFHGVMFDVQDGRVLRQIVEPISVPDPLHGARWALYADGDGFDFGTFLDAAIPGTQDTDFYLEFFESLRVYGAAFTTRAAFDSETDTITTIRLQDPNQQIPEPTAWLLLGDGLITIGLRRNSSTLRHPPRSRETLESDQRGLLAIGRSFAADARAKARNPAAGSSARD
jgi:hypothetical protein